MSIKILSPDVIHILRSGVSISSLESCIEELIYNSLDAGATCIAIRIDINTSYIEIVDNGEGISSTNFELIGDRYATSKCKSVEDLAALCHYGYRGEALASLIKMSSIVKIISKSKSSSETFAKTFKNGISTSLSQFYPPRLSVGTTIYITNFMCNLPVRQKIMMEKLSLDSCKKHIRQLMLIHPQVSFTLHNLITNDTCLDIPKANSELMRFSYLFGQSITLTMQRIEHSSKGITSRCYLGSKGRDNKSLQFIFVNKKLILKSKLHKVLNDLILRLVLDKQKMIYSYKKSLEPQYAVFFVMFKCPLDNYDICFEPRKSIIEFKDWGVITNFFESVISLYRKKHNILGSNDSEADHSKEPSKKENPVQNLEVDFALTSLAVKRPKLIDESIIDLESSSKIKTVEENANPLFLNKPTTCWPLQNKFNQTKRISLKGFEKSPASFGLSKLRTLASLNSMMSKFKYEIPKRKASGLTRMRVEKTSSKIKNLPSVSHSLIVPQISNERLNESDQVILSEVDKILENLDSLQDSNVIQEPIDSYRSFSSNSSFEIEIFPTSSKSLDLNLFSTSSAPKSVKNLEIGSYFEKKNMLGNQELENAKRILAIDLISPDNNLFKNDKYSFSSKIESNLDLQVLSEPEILAEEDKVSFTSNSDTTLDLQVLSEPEILAEEVIPPERKKMGINENFKIKESAKVENNENQREWLKEIDPLTKQIIFVDSLSGNSYFTCPENDPQKLDVPDNQSNSFNPKWSKQNLFKNKIDKESNKMVELLQLWKNPIFQNPSLGTELPNLEKSITQFQSLTKSIFRDIEVIGQMDNKFIPCVASSNAKKLLLLFDQHAVHERIRLELFIDEVLSEQANCSLASPVLLDVSEEEANRIPFRSQQLKRIGVELSIISKTTLAVLNVPPCLQHYKNSIPAVIRELLQDTLELMPPTLLNHLKSQACHGAVKFGDPLDLEECKLLIEQLADCKLPFQCAHGRPSCIPLLQLPLISAGKNVPPNLNNLRRKNPDTQTPLQT